MPSKDISRYLFQPEKRYVGARMQQGRVITDDDLNAHRRLHAEDIRRSLAEIICSKGTPNNGFRIGQVTTPDGGGYDFPISAGSFYLGGLRFELLESEQLLTQRDWLQIDAEPLEGNPPTLPPRPETAATFLVYLRAWEQVVTSVEDSELIEHALGGPDTSVFVRRMRRVEIFELPEGFQGGCAEAFAALTQSMPQATVEADSCEVRSLATLTVQFTEETTQDPCQPTSLQGFIGAENQAIRVQLTAPNRFVWGYDNASPLYRVQVDEADPQEIRFLTLPRDQLSQPTTEHVVEILTWGALLPNDEKVAERPPYSHFTRVADSFDPETGILRVVDSVPQQWLTWLDTHPEYRSARDDEDEAAYFYLRVWTGRPPEAAASPDHLFDPTDPTADPIPLVGTGLSLNFHHLGRPGDHWIIAARPNTPEQLVPWILLQEAPAAGPREFLAPLSLIEWTLDDNQSIAPLVRDCRPKFRPLCDIRGCCTLTVGDGTTSHGDFDTIQAALDHLPEEGGEICLLPGMHRANVRIEGRHDIRIHGCDKQTRVVPGRDQHQTAIFTVVDSTCITLEHMDAVNFGGPVFVLEESEDGTLEEILIAHNRIVGGVQAIRVNGGSRVQVYWNQIRVLDRVEGREAIEILAEDSLIERNDIGILPAEPEPPGEPPPPEDRDPADPCAEFESYYANIVLLVNVLRETFSSFPNIAVLLADLDPQQPYRALGGVRIVAGSEKIKVLENRIIGGAGNGITLGGSPSGAPIVEEPSDDQGDHRVVHDGEQSFVAAVFLNELSDDRLPDITLRIVRTDGEPLERSGDTNGGERWMTLNQVPQGEYRVLVEYPTFYQIVDIVTQTVPDNAQFVAHLVIVERRTAPPRPDLAFIYDLRIHANEISAMGLSGIGNPSVGGVQVPFSAADDVTAIQVAPAGVPIVGASITENDIAHCLLNPFNDALIALTQLRGLGGISLGIGSNINISENRIHEIGVHPAVPECGIFFGIGDQLEIHRNQISDNRRLDILTPPNLGIRGGIVVGTAMDLFALAGREFLINEYAARIHDNVVRQAVGHALLLGGRGPVSIDANRFHTLREAPGPLGQLNSTVLVLNVMQGSQLQSRCVLFNNNQVVAGQATRSLTNVIVFTPEDLGFDGNVIESRSLGFDPTDLVSWLVNAVVFGETVRVTDSRFKEPDSTINFDLGLVQIVISLLSTGVELNNTTNNQGDHCIFATSQSSDPTALVTAGNQVIDDQICPQLDAPIGSTGSNALVGLSPRERALFQ